MEKIIENIVYLGYMIKVFFLFIAFRCSCAVLSLVFNYLGYSQTEISTIQDAMPPFLALISVNASSVYLA